MNLTRWTVRIVVLVAMIGGGALLIERQSDQNQQAALMMFVVNLRVAVSAYASEHAGKLPRTNDLLADLQQTPYLPTQTPHGFSLVGVERTNSTSFTVQIGCIGGRSAVNACADLAKRMYGREFVGSITGAGSQQMSVEMSIN